MDHDNPIRTAQLDGIIGSAIYSPCERYRYSLDCSLIETSLPFGRAQRCLWIMLNPSTATEEQFDPTVRRCWGYSNAWGYESMTVCNLFALRSTDPGALKRIADPVGPDNDRYIQWQAARADLIVLAWGNHGTFRDRGVAVIRLLGVDARSKMRVLKLTGTGQPAHPLYLPKRLRPMLYDPLLLRVIG